MGLWSLLNFFRKSPVTTSAPAPIKRKRAKKSRQSRFEQVESRRLMDADPLKVGMVYIEEDSGSDLHGDTFEIKFEGGAPGTQLTQLIIDTDHGPTGWSVGDLFFDTIKGGWGADEAFPMQIVSSSGIQEVTWSVADGGTKLILNFKGFDVGEKLVFSIDVDEVQDYDPSITNQDLINEGVDPITSGVEFQGSMLTATFVAPHYYEVTGTSEFRNNYDPLFAGTTLLRTDSNPSGLPFDNFDGKRDRSTGTMLPLQQQPLPISIGGRVYLDNDLDLTQDAGEQGLSGVTLGLWKKQGNSYVFTGFTTTTNSLGDYEFGTNLGLTPGTYQVRETQPTGYFSVGSIVGKVGGNTVGSTVAGDKDILTEITIPLGDMHGVRYDFAEALAAAVSGYVYVDADNDGVFDPGETPLAGVQIQVIPVNTISPQSVITLVTDANGFYEATGLAPGTYRIIQPTQPTGYFDGLDTPGTVNGVQVGTVNNPGDSLEMIVLGGGATGIRYNFGELEPASISGNVHLTNKDGDCYYEGWENNPVVGAVILLKDASGTVIAQTVTDSNGNYKFDKLPPGTYTIVEQTPVGLIDGGDHIGKVGGVLNGTKSANDTISNIVLGPGAKGVSYDFCEKLPASVSGKVWVDTTPNCTYDAGEALLAGVTIRLYDSAGNLVATTQTNALGEYIFAGLNPGTYTIRETQPLAYFDGCEQAGSEGGDDSQDDVISQINLGSGVVAVNYDFSEIPPAAISGYVFQDGAPIVTPNGQVPDNVEDYRDGLLTPDDIRIGGVLLELRHTLTGELVTAEDALPGMYPPGAIRVWTDANGFYQFRGLKAGNYSVFQAQPEGYIDSKDTAGTTSGLAVNRNTLVSPLLVQRFATQGVSFRFDAILQIPLAAGQESQLNNFSEVKITTYVIPPDPPKELDPPPEDPEFIPPVQLEIPPPLAPILIKPQDVITGGGGIFTWHLSIIDAGLPRTNGRATRMADVVYRSVLFVDKTDWQSERLRDGIWTIHTGDDSAQSPHFAFGIPGALPVAGDWNGDGRSELGVFYKGEWFLDLNGNGKWDEGDLWAKLGDANDQPVTGDWDGDGKDDIGIFGPEWPGDERHIENEPGLPDPDNAPKAMPRAKNLPPDYDEATDGERLLRLTARGKERADLIDHVFQFGNSVDVAITGDWNGDGIASIGVFRDGKWHLDMDGDGRWSEGDKVAHFGQKGDRPVVGDFNGDGIDDLGVFRGGKFYLDTNSDRQLDDGDDVIELGEMGDKPVAGDFNGDGIDEVAVYRDQPGTTPVGDSQ